MYISKINSCVKISYLYNHLKLIENIIFTYGRGSAQPALYENDVLKIKIPIPPLDYQNKMEQTLSNLDKLDEELNKMIQQNEDNIKTAFLNSLDDYGNPNGFNIDKLIDLDTNEEIKEVPKKKTKSKSTI
jgi:restriction endonuclease S subunit